MKLPHPHHSSARRHGRRWMLLLAATLTAAVLTAVVPSPAVAHTELIGSTPASGLKLETAPRMASLEFSGDVDASFATVLLSVDGRPSRPLEVTAGPSASVLRAALPSIDVPGSTATRWRIDYRVTSVDGHPIQGDITFTVTAAAAPGDGRTTPAGERSGSPSRTADTEAQAPGPTPRWVYVAAPLLLVMLALPAVLVLARRRRRDDGRQVDGGGS